MYSVIVFTEENAVEAVPSTWIISDVSLNKLCLWPNLKGQQLTNALQESRNPHFSWKAHPCRIIKEEPDFLKARSIAERYSTSSDIESGGDCRRREAPSFFVDSFSNEGSQRAKVMRRAEERVSTNVAFKPLKPQKQYRPVSLPPLPQTSASTSTCGVDLDEEENLESVGSSSSLTFSSSQPPPPPPPACAPTPPPRTLTGVSIRKRYEELCNVCRSENIDPFSREGLLFFLAANNAKMCSLAARITILEKRQKENAMRDPHISARETMERFNRPVIKTMDDYDKFVVTPGLKSWLSTEGGSNEKELVFRILAALLDPVLQTKINRTGIGKVALHLSIISMIEDIVLEKFPSSTKLSVGQSISRFFKNASDRHGGRDKRRSQKRVALLPIDSDCSEID